MVRWDTADYTGKLGERRGSTGWSVGYKIYETVCITKGELVKWDTEK